MPNKHKVKPGDCMYSIAFQFGFTADELWALAENQNLATQTDGTQKELLMPGQTVTVPDRTTKQEGRGTEGTHPFQLKNTPVYFRVQFLNEGEPRADVPYLIQVNGKNTQGQTDADGKIEHAISPDVMEVKLRLGPVDGAEDYVFKVGALDPISTTSGIQARLRNLGYDPGPIDGIIGPRTRRALLIFQKDNELETSGQIDQATKDKLKELHQS